VEPELIAILVSLAACTVGVGAVALALGLSRLQAAIWALIATAGLAALVVAGVYAVLAECLFGDEGFMWQWSPRREFCEEENSPAQLGGYALLALPPLLAALAMFLWSRGRRSSGYILTFSLLGLLLPFLPLLYIEALPVYPIETTPVLHDPYLRLAADGRPVRACYVHGIAVGSEKLQPTEDTVRVCADLAPTPQAAALTSAYDGGRTSYALTWLGRALTENGMDTGTHWEGLVVERIYRLPEREARRDASLIRT
jgi:hypothetical protein